MDIGFESRQFAAGAGGEKAVIQAGEPWSHGAFRQRSGGVEAGEGQQQGAGGAAGPDPRSLPCGTLGFTLWALGCSKVTSLLSINPRGCW